jgi:hypothetical protein
MRAGWVSQPAKKRDFEAVPGFAVVPGWYHSAHLEPGASKAEAPGVGLDFRPSAGLSGVPVSGASV